MLIPTKNPDRKIFVSNWLVIMAVLFIGIITGPLFHAGTKINAQRQERIACKNFETQAAAQETYNKFISVPELAHLVSRMDANHDGVACNNLLRKARNE